MSGHWKARARHLRRTLGYGMLVALILLASLVGLLSQLLPVLERHPERIAAWLGEQAGQPVGFDRLQARWTRAGPLLTLDRLRIGASENPLRIERAELLVSIYAGFLPNRTLTELRLDGLSLVLVQDQAGAWSLLGLAQGGGDGDPLAVLQGLGELSIRDAALTVRLVRRDLEFVVPDLDARLRVDEQRIRAGVLARMRPDRPPLAIVLDSDRHGGGQLWFGGEEVDAGALAQATGLVGIEPLAGAGALAVWMELHDGAPTAIRLEADLEGLILRGIEPLAPDPGPGSARGETVADFPSSALPESGAAPDIPASVGIEPRLAIEQWRASLSWRRWGDDGWRLELPRLRWRDGTGEYRLDGLLAGDGVRGGLEAPALDLGPWLSLLALSDRVEPSLRRWLYLAAPRGRLSGIEAVGGFGDGLRGRARIESLSWLATEAMPGFEGIEAGLSFDRHALALSFDPEVRPRLHWPEAFGPPVELSLTGAARAWRQGDGFAVDTEALRLSAEGFALAPNLRLDASDPGAIALHASAEIEPGPATALKRFWLRHDMSPDLIEWLDRAIVGGELERGRAVFGGALADWPFRRHEGHFQAELRLTGLPLRFSPNWPAAERLDADVTLTGKSALVEGSGAIAGAEVRRVRGRIEDFRASVLDLDLDAAGFGVEVLELLRESPLMDSQGAHLRALRLGGRARVRLHLLQPLKVELGSARLRGTADLIAAPLAHSGWDIAFDRADGRLRFSLDGLAAEELRVSLGGDLASFSLATGSGFVSDPDLVAEASLRGRFSAAPLLDRAPDLDWLRPYLDGRGDWNIGVRVPRERPGQPDPPARLSIESDLRGIALALPAPLRKPADQTLPLRVTMSIPIQAEPLSVDIGALMALRARVAEDGSLDGGIGFGGAGGTEHAGRGLRIVGQVAVLDAAGWAGFAAGGSERGLLHSVEIQAGELDLLDRAFVDTQITMKVEADRATLDFDGPEIAGRLVFPRDGIDALTGEFQRLHWPSGRMASIATGNPDPTALPPLRLRVEDLRFGAARLGEARLHTYPTPEGLHVERLETRSGMLNFSASGDWIRIDGSARSRFALEFQSDDLGRMLAALGFAGLVEGGPTRADMVARWPGSPAAFGLSRVDGVLNLKVGQGRFLDVEPGGAGRLLGLVSLAEVPRRLLLDFRDLFGEGLQFNAIEGQFALGAGVAVTDDLEITSSAARIKVRGRTLLTEERYDQTIEILPKTSALFPAVGALAGGPAGVALGALAQAILKSPLQQMGRSLIRVTGPWRDPVIETLERGADRGDNDPSMRDPLQPSQEPADSRPPSSDS